MKQLLSKILGSKPPQPSAPTLQQWSQDNNLLPWLDQQNAEDQINQRQEASKISKDDADLARHWIRDGYVHLENAVPTDVVDQLNEDCENLWDPDTKPIEGLDFKTIILDEKEEIIPVMAHKDILKLSDEQRRYAKNRGLWRLHGLHFHNENAKTVFENKKIKDTVSFLLGVETNPTFSIKFMRGSEQHVHQDLMVFHIHPPQFLIGVWIALEDIHPDSGPLHYWPGSQREKFFKDFNNYPQTNLRTASPETKEAYEKHLDEIKNKYEEQEFLPKKGDALLWHAMLLHSGSPVKDSSKTRKSFVIHYIPEGMDKTNEIVGPFNW